jgi:acyl carrier protein
MAHPTFARVAYIVSAIARRPIQDVTPGARWNDLGVDELKYSRIIIALESEFGFSIPESDALASSTPGELASAIVRKQQRAA